MIRFMLLAILVVTCGLSCPTDFQARDPFVLPVETEFFLLNLTRDRYLTAGLRGNDALGSGNNRPFVQSELLPPGAVLRRRFFDLFPETGGCPDRIDIRVHLYHRVNAGVPIGLDPGEAIVPIAFASDEFLGVPACETNIVASTYTIVLRESQNDDGELIFRQDIPGFDVPIKMLNGRKLPNLEQVPPLLASEPLMGQVLSPQGEPVPNIGVLLRTRFRVTDNDQAICPDEPVGRCFSDPIAIDVSDAVGRFTFDRPPGAYRVEMFADGFLFRPVSIIVESPLNNITFIAEPE